MTNLFLLLGLCSLFSCAPKSVDDCEFSTTVYGKRIQHAQLPLVLYVSQDVPQEFFEIMQESATEINRHKSYIVLYRGDIVAGTRQRNFTNEVYFVNSWEDDRKVEQGRTHVWWTINSGISETDVLINVDDFDWKLGGFNFKTLITHEFLHALGMKHQNDDNDGIMYPYLAQYQSRGMTEREYKNLECAYGK